jgi:acetolactate synthase-1/2/3 large subunit
MTNVADAIVASLRDAGVRNVFGVPGGGSNLDLVAACGRAAVPFVLTATETGGAIAAIAQSEITGRPGACLTTLGPGVAAVVNGVACALLERAPLLVFTDAAADGTAFQHQRLDHHALLAPVTKWSTAIDDADAADVIAQAIACATAEPCGPVHIECPGDVLARPFADSPGPAAERRDSPAKQRKRQRGNGTGSANALDLLRRSERPLLLVGLGARGAAATASIRALCTSHRIPALVTYKAKGVVADADPWFAGVLTNGAIERPVIEQADALIAIGLDEVELLPRAWTYAQPMVHVPSSETAALADALDVSRWSHAALQQALARQRAAVCVAAARFPPHRVVEIAARAAPRSRVAVDAGAHMFPATMLWPVAEPNGMLISNGLSTMGFALPAAIGAALLQRQAGHGGERHTLALTGDGGLLMCAGELATAARESVHLIVIVFNDQALSLIDIKQQQRRMSRSGVDIAPVDWRALAESMGVRGHTATTESELAGALDTALEYRGPSLVDVRVDAAGYAETLKAVRG